MRNGCSHGKKWVEPCPHCEAISLRRAIAYHRERLESALARMAEINQPLEIAPC